jgi:CHASE2 domain-containing sensor protein
LLATLLRCGDLCVLAHEHAHDTVPVTIDRPFYMELTERAAEAGVEMHYGQLEVDRKGRIRRTFVTELHGSPIEPFAVALLNRASRKAVLAELVRRNRQHELINFRRMPEARIKRYEIVRDPATDSGLFRGKIVLMGACEVKEDMHSTPLTASFGTTGTDMSGVELHANTISTMLDQDYLIPLPLSWLFVCAWCFGFVLLCRRFVHQDQLLYHLALEALVFFILTALLWVISGVLLNLVKVKLEPTPFIATSIFCGGWLHFYDPFVKRLSEWKKRTKALKA